MDLRQPSTEETARCAAGSSRVGGGVGGAKEPQGAAVEDKQGQRVPKTERQ